jgi:Spy/CpxP family protein refolding chaperone
MGRGSILYVLIPAAGLGVFGWLGCQGQKDAASSASSTAASSATPPQSALSAPPRAHPKFARHGGIASALFHGANEIALAKDQQASVDAIEEDLRSDDGVVRAAMKAFRADLVAGVRGGKLDAAKLTSDDGAIDKAISDHQAKEAAALDALHKLLTPAERATLVGAVQSKRAERESHMMGWLNGKESDGGNTDWVKRRLDRLTADLALDPQQQKQAAAVLAKPSGPPNGAVLAARWEERKARVDALLTAFAADTFDAKGVDLGTMPGKTPHEAMDRMVEFFTALVPILHPDQRDKLATSLDRPFGAMNRPAGTAGPVRGPADDIAFPFVEPGEAPADDPAAGR